MFQKDLLPGINGQILENKEARDDSVLHGVSRSAKILGWTFIGLLDTFMLFYILLFAFTQSTSHQSAWARSFGVWLLTDVLFVSTIMVWLMHILIPSMVMKEVGTIKKKLLSSVATYYQTLHERKADGIDVDESTADAKT